MVAALERLVDQRVAAALADRPAESEPVWLSLSEAAAYLRVSPRTLARMRKQGRLRCRISAVGCSCTVTILTLLSHESSQRNRDCCCQLLAVCSRRIVGTMRVDAC